MTSMFTSFAPFRRKDRHDHDRILNTRWGDAEISAPMHGAWNSGERDQAQESPDLDRELPPTPPQDNDIFDGVFIVHEDEERQPEHDLADTSERENATITISLPWKKRRNTHGRKISQHMTPVINPKFASSRRMDMMPPLSTAEAAAAVPLPESRVNSPLARVSATASPVSTFRSRLADPSLAEILSPVPEGFVKTGPSSRTPLNNAPMQAEEDESYQRPSISSSLGLNTAGREHTTVAYNPDGLGGLTMSSQATIGSAGYDLTRPDSRGIGCTARMRASSRPRASSASRSASVDPIAHRSASVEAYVRRAPSVEPQIWRPASVDPVFRRAPSADPIQRRALSVEPTGSRTQSVDRYARRQRVAAPTYYHDDVDIQLPAPNDLEPLRQRAPSVEPGRRRAPSADPNGRRAQSARTNHRTEDDGDRMRSLTPALAGPNSRRATSREPRGRRGVSAGPRPRVRFQSENIRSHHRDAFSSEDDSSDELEQPRRNYRKHPERTSSLPPASYYPHHSRASPQPVLIPISIPVSNNTTTKKATMHRNPTQSGNTSDSSSSSSSSAHSHPSTTSHSTTRKCTCECGTISSFSAASSSSESERETTRAPTRTLPYESTTSNGSTQVLVSFPNDTSHNATLRREERKRATEKAARQLMRERREKEKERGVVLVGGDAFGGDSDVEGLSGYEKTRHVFGADFAAVAEAGKEKEKEVELVPNAEEIWG